MSHKIGYEDIIFIWIALSPAFYETPQLSHLWDVIT